ncbi:MAG: stage III sporulation protein AD [Bacillota bacterium]
MDIMQIIGLALVAAIVSVFLKETNSYTSALLVSVVVGIIIFVALLDDVAYILKSLEELAVKAKVNQVYLSTVLKIIGLAYIAEFGTQISRDAGETAIAGRIEFAAKVLILVLAVPIFTAVFETIIRLLP